ncbi:claudin [Sarotherodon galilaeus]
MSRRSRASRMQQHIHCDSCYSRRCRARVEASVCCAVTPCRLHCGALFHLCKEEDHLLLCPNVRVPCINAAYGCPVQLPRSSRASHLQVCPASVVCCTMEWLRWPTDDTNPHSHKALQDNLVKESEGQEEALDLAMAIIDQKDLYSRLKMKPLYPELTEGEEEEINDEMKEEAAVGGVVNGVVIEDTSEGSESKAYDGLYVDVGTQTYSFRSAPFKGKTTLAEVMVDRPLKLHLQLQAESVNSRHNRASCVFTFLCGHTFHRREFATHVRNVHCEIHTCLSGWFEQRCPLAYLGCTYSQRRFHPSTHKAAVTYNKELRSFNLRPTFEGLVGDNSPTSSEGSGDSLSSLPYEVLCHMASFLDSLSLFQLALVSHLMRQVCSTLLKERGMVTLRWEKKTYSHGRTKWRAKPVWEFSHLFSSVDSWHMADIPPISAHLKVCPYYEVSLHSKPVFLPSMDEKQRCSQKSSSLVNHFTGNR